MVYNPSDSRTARWPILATALVFAGSTLALIALMGVMRLASPLDHELADRIDEAYRARETSGRRLSDFTPFSWDRVCLFGADATKQHVDAVLGIEWGQAGGDVGGRQDLLVFVGDGVVVRAAQLPLGTMRRPERGGDCRTPEEAVMRR